MDKLYKFTVHEVVIKVAIEFCLEAHLHCFLFGDVFDFFVQ